MSNKAPKKLTLHRETVMSLSSAQLDGVNGGTAPWWWETSAQCPKPRPTILEGPTAVLDIVGKTTTVVPTCHRPVDTRTL